MRATLGCRDSLLCVLEEEGGAEMCGRGVETSGAESVRDMGGVGSDVSLLPDNTSTLPPHTAVPTENVMPATLAGTAGLPKDTEGGAAGVGGGVLPPSDTATPGGSTELVLSCSKGRDSPAVGGVAGVRGRLQEGRAGEEELGRDKLDC